MDSITQFTLGAAVGLSCVKKEPRKIAMTSGILATLPDLDVFLKYSDPLTAAVNHRGFSHSILFLTLLAFFLAYIFHKTKFLKLNINFMRWFLLIFLVFITHIFLDALTIYGTKLFWPLDIPNVMIGSIFIIDLIYTAPLLITFVMVMVKNKIITYKKYSINSLAIIVTTSYLLLAFGLKTYVNQQIIKPDLVGSYSSFSTPIPLNILVWRIVMIDDIYYYETYYNIITGQMKWQKTKHFKNEFKIDNDQAIKKYAKFSRGFYKLSKINDKLIISDLRMGSYNNLVFNFHIAKKVNNYFQAIKPSREKIAKLRFKDLFNYETR